MNISGPFVCDTPPPGYRLCAGVFLLNRRGDVFVGHRSDWVRRAAQDGLSNKPWQMPQGGIDPGETPAQAALREMHEEIGTGKGAILGESRQWHCYDLPAAIAAGKWGGKYRGQAQKWFAIGFDGCDSDINLVTQHPEFDDWKWVMAEDICDLAVAFKRSVYARILEEFHPLVLQLRNAAQP